MAVSSVVSFLARGGPVMIPLTVCSVLSLAVILERAWFWLRVAGAHEEEQVLELAARGKWDDAIDAGRAARSPAARVLIAALTHRDTSPTVAMEAAARDELAP